MKRKMLVFGTLTLLGTGAAFAWAGAGENQSVMKVPAAICAPDCCVPNAPPCDPDDCCEDEMCCER